MAEMNSNAFGTYAQTASSYSGSFAQIAGGIMQALQAKSLGRYNARVAEYNAQAEAWALEIEAQQHERLAQLSEYDLLISAAAANYRDRQILTEARRLEGTARARIGASGLAFTGSPLAVLEANAREAEEARLVSRYQASLEQRAIREDITQREYAAALARYGMGERLRLGRQESALASWQADIAGRQGMITALGGVASAAGTYGTA